MRKEKKHFKVDMGKYEHNPLHRNGSPQKSQWDKEKVSILTEEKIWISSLSKKRQEANSQDKQESYGLFLCDNKPCYLGFSAQISANSKYRLFIAKFLSSLVSNIETWHGFPADPTQNSQDRPKEETLQKWVSNRYLSKAKISKILKGKKCDLSK